VAAISCHLLVKVLGGSERTDETGRNSRRKASDCGRDTPCNPQTGNFAEKLDYADRLMIIPTLNETKGKGLQVSRSLTAHRNDRNVVR
jgi:hypothetical protein